MDSGKPCIVANETDRPARDGWTFLSDADAAAAAGNNLVARGTQFVCRASPSGAGPQLLSCAENLEALFAFKRRILSKLGKVPVVENDQAAVLAWYPSTRTALLWNPRPERTNFHVRCGPHLREVTLDPLASVLLPDLKP